MGIGSEEISEDKNGADDLCIGIFADNMFDGGEEFVFVHLMWIISYSLLCVFISIIYH